MKNGIVIANPIHRADVDDVFEEDEIIAWIKKNYYPGEVFSLEELTEWAEDNGFVKETEE